MVRELASMISIVACCHGAKLCAHAARDFRSEQNDPGHSTTLLTCLSLCNTQARAVNLIHAILCNDEGVTQARGC